MPSSMTHTYFGLDVYNRLNNRCKSRIKDSLEYFKTFCQGPDVFYFYNLFLGKKSKKVYEVGSLIHKRDTRKFFVNLVRIISDNHLESNSSVMSYLYGYMCHYYLDYMCHPFIFYKTGKFNSKDASTYKYNTMHEDMEFFIDRYLIYNRENIEPCKYKIHKKFLNIKDMDNDLRNTIKNSFNIYKLDNDMNKDIDKIYLKSILDMKKFFRIFNYDYLGVKKEIYSFIDFITPRWITKVKSLSYRGDYEKKVTYLNLNNDIWYNPCDKKLKYNYSFMELYDIAIDKCVEAIEMVDEMFYKNKIDDKMLNIIFRNLSYLTGIDCNSKLKMKYFEF